MKKSMALLIGALLNIISADWIELASRLMVSPSLTGKAQKVSLVWQATMVILCGRIRV